jgi:hypothetical protein
VFDFDTPGNNHFLAVRQLEVVGKLYNCLPDVVGFVNGIPLVFFELKAHRRRRRRRGKPGYLVARHVCAASADGFVRELFAV